MSVRDQMFRQVNAHLQSGLLGQEHIADLNRASDQQMAEWLDVIEAIRQQNPNIQRSAIPPIIDFLPPIGLPPERGW